MKNLVLLVTVFGALNVSALKTPETSSLFIAHTDEVSRVVSYLLRPDLLDYHRQTIYFTSRCMTDDGRFLVLSSSPNEFKPHPGRPSRDKALIDFEKDEAFHLKGTDNWYTPWIDVQRDHLWYVNREGVHFRDLKADPHRDVLVCELPESIAYRPGTRYGFGYGTHLTLSPDRRRIFLDIHTGDGVYRQGCLNLDTRQWEEWSQTPFLCNHGQFNPVDPHMGMCAFEYAWFLTPDELPEGGHEGLAMTAAPWVTTVRRPRDYIYPRLWLFTDKGEKWMVPSRITNSASHEMFDWDGAGFYWCSGGVVHHDFATERQQLIVPCRAAHATLTEDKRFLTFDSIWWGGFRGAGWQTSFWNRDTHRGVYIHSRNPPMASCLADESKLHPDAHPMFVCREKYVACTKICAAPAGSPTNMNYMTVSLTPVRQLIDLTAAERQCVTPTRLPVADFSAADVDGTPCELEIDAGRLLAQKVPLAKPAVNPLYNAYAAYALEATVAGKTVPVACEPLQHPYRYTEGAVLRFTPPAGATALTLVVDAPGRFEVRDAELCDNLFDRRNLRDLYPPKAAAVSRPDETPRAAAVADVRAAAGRPVKFWLDFRNFAWQTWWGDVLLEQFDAAGKRLGPVLGETFDNLECLSNRRLSIRATGRLAADAAEVRLFFVGTTDQEKPTQIEVQQLNLRVARTLDPKGIWAAPRPELPRTAAETTRADWRPLEALFGAEPVRRYLGGVQLTGDAVLRNADKREIFISGHGRTVDLDMQGHTLTLGGSGRIRFDGLSVKRPGRIVVEDGIDFSLMERNTFLNGSAANALVCRNCRNLLFNRKEGLSPWTLDATGLACLLINGGDRKRDSTRPEAAFWEGPVRVGAKPLNVNVGEFGFAFKGSVTGAGLNVWGRAEKPGSLHLLNAANDFTEGVTARNVNLHVAVPGALPAAGGALTLKDAAVCLDAPDADYALPALKVAGSGAVKGGRGAWREVVKTGKGELVWDSLTTADALDVREGTVRLAFDRSRRTIAGLLESARVDFSEAKSKGLWKWLAERRFAPVRVQPSPAAYYDGTHPFWCEGAPDTNSVYRCAFAYRGYLWNNAATNVTWSFAGVGGTHLYVHVNGREVLRFTDPASDSRGEAVLKPGPNVFEVSGYVFPFKCARRTSFGRSTKLQWPAEDFALGYDPLNRHSRDQRDYLKLVDPGDGSLLTWTLPEKIEEGITVPPGATRPIRRQAAFKTVKGTMAMLPNGDRIVAPLKH